MFKIALMILVAANVLVASTAGARPQLATPQENTSNYPAGDVFFFQFLGDHDEVMRAEDYKNFYPVLKRMSAAGFKVTMNWVASINDLKAALKNTRPTIIIWSSHGQPGGISDKLDEENLLPPDFFNDISPTVYQFVVATCYGKLAIKNYDLSKARKTKFIGWEIPLSTQYLNDQLFKNWNFLDNYPQPRAHNNLICRSSGESSQLVSTLSGKVVSVFKDLEGCFKAWNSASKGLVCANNIVDKRLVIFDILGNQRAAESDYTAVDQWCHELPSRVYKNRVCLLDEKTSNMGVYNLQTHKLEPGLSFNSSVECYKYLWSQK